MNAIRTFAGKHRQNVTPEQVAALAAAGNVSRWQMVSAGAGDGAAVQRALGEG